MSKTYDIAIVGGGHNGLVAGAYLAKNGLDVLVLEKRDIVGGAVSTKEIIPGYQFDLGGSAHILIRLTSIVEDLELEKFGLDYIEVDPLFYSPFQDGTDFYIYRDLERTVDHLEERFPGDGISYKKFIESWTPFSSAVRDSFLEPPKFSKLRTSFESIKGKTPLQILNAVRQPYGSLLDSYFKSEKLKTQMAWMGAQSGPPPSQSFSGPFVLWQPLYHEGGMARPRGGSGMLTQALAKCIEHHGGEVRTDSAVTAILEKVGNTFVLNTNEGSDKARRVICATHLRTTQQMLPKGKLGRPITDKEIGNGFGAIIRLALNRPVRYAASSSADARIAMQLICEDRAQIDKAYQEYKKGKPSSSPPIVAMSFSAVDPSLCPEGCEALWLWAQYYPYQMKVGNWIDKEEEIEQSILDQFEKYAPGTKSSIVGSLFQHPKWLEENLGLHRGNVMHLEMNVSKMFFQRPRIGMASYKTPIEGLYLSGASTHPGGGIMGASGRNTAKVIMADIETEAGRGKS